MSGISRLQKNGLPTGMNSGGQNPTAVGKIQGAGGVGSMPKPAGTGIPGRKKGNLFQKK